MKQNKNEAIRYVICIILSLWVAVLMLYISTYPSKEYEVIANTLYITTDLSNGRYRIYLSKDGDNWKNYIEIAKDKVRNNISNIYFFPPDTLFVLNVGGETISNIQSTDLKIIDVMSEDILVMKDNTWVATERLRYEVDGRYVERFSPGSPRIAYRLTYDSIMCSSPLWICFEPNLNGFTICDSTGHAIDIYI